MNPRRRTGGLLASTAIYTAGDLLTTLLSGFVFIPLYLHYMTPAEYAIYGTVTVMTTMLGVIFSLGLSSAVGRYFFVYRPSGREYAFLGSIWLFQTLVALVLTAVALLWGESLWRLITPDIPFQPYIWFVAIGAFLTFGAFIYPLWLRVQERPLGFVSLQVAGAGSYAVLLVVLVVALGEGAQGALGAALGSNALLALLAVLLLGRKAQWSMDMSLIRPSLAFGGWMVLGTFVYYILNRSQIFFLQHYGDLTSAGVFFLGQQLGGLITMISIAFGKAWQPVVYSSHTDDEAAAAIARISKFFVAGMLYIVLGVTLLSSEILYVFANPEYYGAGVVIRIVAIASFIYVLGTLSNSALLYQKRARLTQVPLLVAVGLNVVLNVLLIPRLQMIGAALAMLLAYLVMTSLSFALAQKCLRVAYDQRALVKISVTAGVIVAGEWVFIPETVGLLPTCIRVGLLIMYPLVLTLTGVFAKSEQKAMWSSVVRIMQLPWSRHKCEKQP